MIGSPHPSESALTSRLHAHAAHFLVFFMFLRPTSWQFFIFFAHCRGHIAPPGITHPIAAPPASTQYRTYTAATVAPP